MTLRSLSLAVLFAIATPSLADVTFIGNGGGTVEKTRDCARGEGQVQCQTDTTYTSTAGKVATKTHLRTTVAGASETVVTLTGPEGNSRTRKRLITWGN